MTTAQDRLDLIPSIGQRQSDIRWDVLNQALVVVGEVQPAQGSNVTVSVNTNSAVKRTLNGLHLNAVDNAGIDPFGQRLRPIWVLEDGTEYPLGVFIFGSMDRLRYDYGLEADVVAVDQTIILDQGIEQTVSLAAGADVRLALVNQFAAALVPAYEVDPLIATVVATPIAWPAGTSRLKVMNDLAAMAGCFSVYFDNAGVGRVTRVPDDSAPPDHVYASGGRIVEGSMVETDDLLEAPNRYLVIDSGATDSPVSAYFDIPAEAPHSITGRGFVVTKTIAEQGLASATEALIRARAAYEQDGGGYEWVQFSSAPDPRHDVFDSVSYLGVTYREQGWSLPLLEGSEMRHDLRRTYQ